MAEIKVTSGRVYLPPEDETKPNERIAIHPETNDSQVIMEDGRTLRETIGPQIIIGQSTDKPTVNCLWAAITETRTS